MRCQAHHLRRPAKLGGAEWAQRHQRFDPEVLPWQAEVMDALADPGVSEVGLLGPAQAGKSRIGEAWIGRNIDIDPGPTLICQPSYTLAQTFVETRINPMIAATETVKAKLLPQPNANSLWLKKFRGMFLWTIWPVAAQFAQRSVRYGWLDDFDQIEDDIEGQGSADALMSGRFAAYEGKQKKFISSSPAREDGGGTEAFVARGTDERLHPRCPQCGERWEIDLLKDLRFDSHRGAEEAEASAHVVCGTGNGCVLRPSARRAVLASLSDLPGRGFIATNASAGGRRRTFRIDGLMALTSWPELARKWREAQIEWELRQDENGLRSFVNTKAGRNYRSKLSGEKPIEADSLKARREQGWRIGTIPPGVKVWVVLVDQQINRLECAAIGFGEGLETWLIDRWSIDVLEDGLTSPAPFSHPEHSRVLLPLFDRRYPLAGLSEAGQSVLSPPPLTVQLDIGGGGAKDEGAAEFAKAFWNAARAIGVHSSRITLTKGGSNPKGELMPRARFADQKKRGGALKTSAQLWLPNVHRIKGVIDARLRREDFGPGYIHLPGGSVGGRALEAHEDEGATGRLLDHHVEEITAEQLKNGKWEKVRPRNETLDHLVAAYAAILRPPFAQSRTHMRWVPAAFRVPAQPLDGRVSPALDAARNERDGDEPGASEPDRVQHGAASPVAAQDERVKAPARKSWVAPRRGGWLNGRRY